MAAKLKLAQAGRNGSALAANTAVRKAAYGTAESLEARTLFSWTAYGDVRFDANGNGTYQVPGDTPVQGATVYADLDEDGTLDTGEPTALTGVNGGYELDLSNTPSVLSVDNYFCGPIRVVPPASYAVATGTPAYHWVAGAGSIGGLDPAGPYNFLLAKPGATSPPSPSSIEIDQCQCEGGQDEEEATEPVSLNFFSRVSELINFSFTWATTNWQTGGIKLGNGFSSGAPRLQRGEGNEIAVVTGNKAEVFDIDSSGNAIARHGSKNQLELTTVEGTTDGLEYVLTTPGGKQYRFNSLDDLTIPEAQRGALVSARGPGGETVEVTAYTADGQFQNVRRTIVDGATTTTEEMLHEYLGGSDPNAGRLERLTLRRSTNGGSTWSAVRKLEFDYYEDYATTSATADSFGNLGDLRTATLKDESGNALETSYYRFYRPGESDGYTGALRYVLDGSAYARLTATLSTGQTPLTASNSTVAAYATRALKYDGSHRVSEVNVAGAGSNQGSGTGRGTFTYSYCTSSNADGYNAWAKKTVREQTGISRTITFTNYIGDVMLRVEEDISSGPSSGKRLATYKRYGEESWNAGKLILTAHPSAFDPQGVSNALYSEALADLVGYCTTTDDATYLGDDFGQVDLFEYASATSVGIDEDTAGNVEGYLAATYTQRGDQTDPIKLSSTTYFAHTYTPGGDGTVAATVHPVAAETVYPSATPGTPGTGRTTDYAYTWQVVSSVSTARPQSITIQRPVVSTGNNGPGGSTRDTDVSFLDSFGNPAWTKDAGGSLTYARFDPVTGALTKSIVDVDTAQTTTFAGLPSGWSTPSGGGLHLTTSIRVDALGRPTKVTDPKGNTTYTIYKDADHEVRTYLGWNSTSHTTTGPILVAREYRPAAGAGDSTVYSEVLTTTATPSYNGTTHEPTGTESITSSNIASLTRSLQNAVGQVTAVDEYFNLSGQTYSQSSSTIGSTSNDSSTGNRHRTTYGTDAGGRVNRVVSPTGTITRTVFDFRSNALESWIGTDDTGASDFLPNGSGGTTNNMTVVMEAEFDESCGCPASSGDGKITKLTRYPGGSATPRVTEYYYDWRSQLMAVKDAVETSESTSVQRPITVYTRNALGQVLSTTVHDGDNVSVTETDGTPTVSGTSKRRSYSEIHYDEQLRPFQSEVWSVNASTGARSGNSLKSDTVYDRRGWVIKQTAPGSAATKFLYDGAGRVIKTYATDAGGDSGWADADDVTGDRVVEQSESTYDANSNVILSLVRQRFHDAVATSTGELGDPSSTTATKARVSYAAAWYDAADRITDEASVGTNGGSAYTRPSTPPSRSDTVLVTSYDYNAAGDLEEVTNPRGISTTSAFDLLGRTKTVTEAGTRVTQYTHNGASQQLTMTAVSGTDQTTRWVYGEVDASVSSLTRSGSVATATSTAHGYKAGESVTIRGATQTEYNGTFVITAVTVNTFTYTVSGSPATTATGTITARRAHDLYSNEMLTAVQYPDKSAGTPGTAITDKETYTLNRLGEAKTYADKNGSVHTYTYDLLGRQLTDAVTTLASGVDNSVLRLQYSYNTQGLPELFTSYNAASGGSVVNEVKRQYNGLGQLTSEYQAHDGAVTGSTPRVQYAYTEMAGGANHGRLKSMTYPDGRVLRYEYGTTGSLNDKISRIQYLADDTGTGSAGTTLESYSYLGLSTVVSQKHPEPNVDLSYVKRSTESAGDAGDQYTGLDRFSRIADQRWLNPTSGTAVDRFQYGYDRNSNVRYKDNKLSAANSEFYGGWCGSSNEYDNLDRLLEFTRGELVDANSDGIPESIATPSRTQTWNLDLLGNWDDVTTDSVTDDRSHNAGNQITSTAAGAPVYDANGNQTADPTRPGPWSGTSLDYDRSYDAWNRQVAATADYPNWECNYSSYVSSRDQSYEYDALGRRIQSLQSATDAQDTNNAYDLGNIFVWHCGTSSTRTESSHLYYSARWQVIDERKTINETGWNYQTSESSEWSEGYGTCVYSLTPTVYESSYSHNDEYVWSAGYVDDLVLRDRSSTGVVADDSSFSSDGKQTTDFAGRTDVARGVAVQTDGRIVAVGSSIGSGTSDFAIARYHADGSLDTSFDGDGKVRTNLGSSEAFSTALIESDGDILAAGYGTNGSGNKDFALARYNADGSLDTTFGSSGIVLTDFDGGDDYVRSIAVQPDGKIVVAGDAWDDTEGKRVLAIARYNADGSLDTSFDTDGKQTLVVGTGDATGNALALQADGKLVVAGAATFATTGLDMVAARFNPDGSLDSGTTGDTDTADLFGTAGVANVDVAGNYGDVANAIAIGTDGRIILAGQDDSYGSGLMALVALHGLDGTLDTSFGTGGKVQVSEGQSANAVAIDGNGRITAAGRTRYDDQLDFFATRLLPSGSFDTSFGSTGTIRTSIDESYDDTAHAAALTPDGGVVLAGYVSDGSSNDFALARYAPGGSATQRLYALQDANYNVTALIDTSGTVVQRFQYDPYGQSTALTSGFSATTDGYDWLYRHQGGRLETATGTYHFRNRDYDPVLGRWLQEDPAGYVDGGSLYLAYLARPVSSTDAMGLDVGWARHGLPYDPWGEKAAEEERRKLAAATASDVQDLLMDLQQALVDHCGTLGADEVNGLRWTKLSAKAVLQALNRPVTDAGEMYDYIFKQGGPSLLVETFTKQKRAEYPGLDDWSIATVEADKVNLNQAKASILISSNASLRAYMVVVIPIAELVTLALNSVPLMLASPFKPSVGAACGPTSYVRLYQPRDPFDYRAIGFFARGAKTRPGNYDYVRTGDGFIYITYRGSHTHPQVIGGGQSVTAAGELTVDSKGVVTSINNGSGTFRPAPSSLKLVEESLTQQGFTVSPNAISAVKK